MMDPIFCIVATNAVSKTSPSGKSRGNSVASAYGITDLSEDGGLPDQMANLSINSPPQSEQELLEVVENYDQCSSALEIPVQAGEIVTYLGSEGSWVFVRTANGADGYIPRRSCRIIHRRSDKNAPHFHQQDLSDVGYYSDHQHNDLDNGAVERTNRYLDFHKRSLSMHDNYRSEENEKYRADSESSSTNGSGFSNRDYSYNSCNNSRHPSELLNDSIDSRDRIFGSIPPSPAVCGRKCGNRCIHKTNPDSVQTVGNPSEIQLKVKNYPIDIELECEQYTSDVNIESEIPITKENNESSSDNLNEQIKTVGSIRRCSLTISSRTNIIEEIEDKKRLQRCLQVNKKVINHVRSTLDEHRRVQKNASSYWKEAGTKIRKGKPRKKMNKCISAPEGLILSVCGHPELIVIKDYEKVGDTDISVSCGDFATIINDTKYTDWIFVQNENGERGYIPTDCTLRHQCKDCENTEGDKEKRKYVRVIGGEDVTDFKPNYDEMNKMIIHEDFESDHPDELKVIIGDTVYLHKDVQSIQDWLWVYSPRQKRFGYIPVYTAKDESEVDKITV